MYTQHPSYKITWFKRLKTKGELNTEHTQTGILVTATQSL